MTILQINKFHYLKGGAERYYLDLGRQLESRGETVVHLAMEDERNIPARNGDRFVGGVDYRAKMGVGDRIRHALRSVYNMEAAELARSIARRDRPAVAHLHNIYHQLSPSVIRALASEGIPIVQTLHDYKLVCPAYLLLTHGEICERCSGGNYMNAFRHRCLLESRGASLVGAAEAYLHSWLRTYDRVELFICPSIFMLEKISSFGIARSRLVHIPYFLPLERYEPADDRGDYYVYAGRLSREKGVATLLSAHARLPRPRPALRILGDGPMRTQLESEKERRGLDDVGFEGYKPTEELARTVARARFVVVPSEWYENYPYAILEAFALGRPVIGTRIGGIPELVRDGETGRTAAPFDAEDLAEAIAGLSADRAGCDRMGRHARSWVADSLQPDLHLDQMVAIYRRFVR